MSRRSFVAPLGLVALLACAACSSSSSGSDTTPPAGDSGSSMKGPGAAYKCTSSGKDAYDTYGSAAFVAVNESIFTDAVAAQTADGGAANLGTSLTLIGTGMPASTSDNLAAFKGKLAAFLVYAYGGPTSITYTDGKTYDGAQDMTVAHTGLNITTDQYDYFVNSVVVPALTSNGVPMSDVMSCFAPVVTDTAFVASIVGH